MVGFDGRENVRSTLGFLESMRPLVVTVKQEVHFVILLIYMANFFKL